MIHPKKSSVLKSLALFGLLFSSSWTSAYAANPMATVYARMQVGRGNKILPPQEKALKTATPSSKVNISLNVITFNILWDKVTKGPTQWIHRKQSLVNLLKRHHPDVVGIQEGFISQMDYITSEFKYSYFGWGTDDGKSHLHDPGKRQSLNPIMYDQNRLMLLEKGVFWYADQPQSPGIFAGEDKHFRNCVWGKFKEKGRKGRIFYVFNTHFSLKDDMRQKQALLLKSKIMQIAGEKAEVIVTGDFNSDAVRDQSYGILTDTKGEISLSDSKMICTGPVSGPSFSGSGLMVNSRAKGTEIDHILVRNISSSIAYKVINDHEGAVYPSDHFPVLTVLKFD